MAIGALAALRAAGRSIPDDVAVVGFDDSPLCLTTEPRLSSVRQPIEEMGREMAQLLMQEIRLPDRAPRRVILDTQLVVRGSSVARVGILGRSGGVADGGRSGMHRRTSDHAKVRRDELRARATSRTASGSTMPSRSRAARICSRPRPRPTAERSTPSTPGSPAATAARSPLERGGATRGRWSPSPAPGPRRPRSMSIHPVRRRAAAHRSVPCRLRLGRGN